jgi:hypothetical protein
VSQSAALEASPRRFRSAEEGEMRAIVTRYLRSTWPGARIIHEFPLRYATNSLDMAAILPSEIIAVEIKSSRDTLDRLERQLRAFAPVCNRIIVALAPKWNESLPQLTMPGRNGGTRYVSQYTEAQTIIRDVRETHIETWTCCAETGVMDKTLGFGGQRFAWPAKMLDLLHSRELERILSGGYDVVRPRAHDFLVHLIHDRFTGPQIVRAVCGALRAREGFAVQSDPPIRELAA